MSRDLADVRIGITAEETRLLQAVILEHCGVCLGSDAGFLFERRLGPRLDALGLASFHQYFHYMTYDPTGPAELEVCIERITTHETYFFREQFQLDALHREIVPNLRSTRPQRPISVWSAGCSTGEEAYTVAMLLAQANIQGAVLGTDISRRALSTADLGTYGLASFRTTDDATRAQHFQPTGPNQWRVNPSLRAMCRFVHLNLLDRARYPELAPFDVILCRNVLMYLSNQARYRIVEGFFDALAPGGYLLLGHSENLLKLTTRFDLVQLSHDLVYRRPA